MRTLFIVNPAAGHGRALERWARASRALRPGRWETRYTEAPGHGAALAREALEQGFEAIVAVGGDGTLGEVVDGYLRAPPELRARAALGTTPAGSGCDAARHFGLHGGPAELSAIVAAKPRALDAGLVEFAGLDGRPARRHFINVTSFGVAGEVAQRARAWGKPLGGAATYLAASLFSLLGTPARELELAADSEALPRGRYHLVSVANTSTTGGGMRIAPTADASDGLLDLVAVGDLARWDLLRRLPALYSGALLGQPGVLHRRIRRLEARSPERVYLNIDGEAAGLLPARFETLPGAVPFLLP